VEVVRAIRARGDLLDLPVVAVTASWLGERPDVLLSEGFSAAVRKPFSGEQLVDVVRGLVPSLQPHPVA
jgi:CheY-like chemotaxis protein